MSEEFIFDPVLALDKQAEIAEMKKNEHDDLLATPKSLEQRENDQTLCKKRTSYGNVSNGAISPNLEAASTGGRPPIAVSKSPSPS